MSVICVECQARHAAMSVTCAEHQPRHGIKPGHGGGVHGGDGGVGGD